MEQHFYACCVNNKDEKFLSQEFQRLTALEEYEYNDNYRLALQGDKRSMTKYNLIKSRGCCGYYDEKIKAPSGKTYLIGFNYGH